MPVDEHHHGRRAGDEDHSGRKRSAEHARPEPGDHPHHRIQRVQRVPLRGNDVERVEHRRAEQPELHHERHDVAHVAVRDDERGEQDAGAGGADDRAQQIQRQPEHRPRRRHAVRGHHHEQHDERDREIDEPSPRWRRSGSGCAENRPC